MVKAKHRVNLCKQGLDFIDAQDVFSGVTCTIEDRGFEYGERRFVTLGMLRDTVVVIAHTEAAGEVRVMSMRKATRHEHKLYLESI